MNILSRLNSREKVKTIKPREIFMSLPTKAPGFGYPRDVQSEVWKKWFDLRNEKNVIIKMNTGSGKTTVGLIILQSCLNEGKGPAVYAVPDKFLVNQVLEEAKKLGVTVTDDKDDYNYLNSKAILITTIQTIVNGHSAFGMRKNNNYPIGSLVIDDVHAGIDKIAGQFMIKIKYGTNQYDELIKLFGAYLKDYNPKKYIDVIEMRDSREILLVPFWEWQKKQEDVYRILVKHSNEDNPDIFFGLPLIEGGLDTCDCIITPRCIEISPKGVDINKIESFAGAERRIFMSATLADDSVFVTSLGLDMDDMKNIVTPENANDIGDRLIIFPKYINSDITEKDIKEKVEEIARKYNVVVIVPSFSRAKFWDPDSKCTVEKDNISDVVGNLKKGGHFGKVVFVNRYDGVDLPDETCRMLVIDGLPPLNSIKDRYIQSVAPKSIILLREQIQRIEQGMGRGIRSNDDECCVVLMGDELTDVLARNKGVDFFSSATKCQYDLSKELWDILVEDSEGKPSLDDIFELARYSLEKNPVWISKCKERLSAIRYSCVANVDYKIVALRKAFEYSLNRQWKDASECVKKIKDIETISTTKGYLCQVQAEYTNKYDAVMSQQILTAGKKISGAILNPIGGIQYDKTINNISQAQMIKKYLDSCKLSPNELLIEIDGILSNLYIGSEYEKFEMSCNSVGEALGFTCSRPDKCTGGYGPDNLWAIDADTYFIIECKSESKVDFITKDYCNQLSGSVNWFRENYSKYNTGWPIIIHPSKIIDDAASPHEKMVVVTENELEKLRKNVRDFYSALCQSGISLFPTEIDKLLKEYRLRKDDLIREYTVKCLKKKNLM